MPAERDRQHKDAIARRGLMLVLSSPSGAGKTTLSRKLLEADPGVELSVSVTTRKQRPGEIDGRDYHFIDAERFETMVKGGELLEWAQVFGHRYGTPRAPVEAALLSGQDVLFDIDWQGTQQLREKADHDLVSVFVLPPSMRDLERRLRRRAQDSDDVIRAASSNAVASRPRDLRLCRNILRRWPKAASLTRSSARRSQASGAFRGTSSTRDEVTLGGGTKALAATSKQMRALQRQPTRTESRP